MALRGGGGVAPSMALRVGVLSMPIIYGCGVRDMPGISTAMWLGIGLSTSVGSR